MGLHYYIIDAFAETAFAGVPVAVFPEASTVSHTQQATLAGEMPASDTVFVQQNAPGEFTLNAWSQGRERQTGAHVALAAASGLLKDSQIKLENNKAEFSFNRVGGNKLDIQVDLARKSHPILIEQSINANIDRYTPSTEEIAATIGLASNDIASSRYSSLIVSCGKPWLFVPLKSYHALREASFHNREWSHSSMPQSLVDSMLLFAPNTDNKGGDFHARVLERGCGTTSDPAIGEAMPAFAVYLCQQKTVQRGRHSFGVRRGANDARQSLLQLEMDNNGNEVIPVRIGGSTAITSQAEILLNIAS